MYLASTCSISAIVCPVSSLGLWISSLNLTYTILLQVSLFLSNSRFVLIIELLDNCLKGFLDAANISTSSRPLASSESKLYVPDEGSV